MKKNKLVKIDTETLEVLKRQKRELSAIENRDVSMGDIIKRTLSGPDIGDRLRIGSMKRRKR